MRTALDAPSETLDQNELTFVSNVREHGWFRTSVLGDETTPAFSYSTGFWINCAQPELIIFGLDAEVAHDVFWDLFRNAKSHGGLPTGCRTDKVFANVPAYALPVAKEFYPNHLGWSRWFYGGDNFPCLQIIWPDRHGIFPWEDHFDAGFEGIQLDLTEHGWTIAIAD